MTIMTIILKSFSVLLTLAALGCVVLTGLALYTPWCLPTHDADAALKPLFFATLLIMGAMLTWLRAD